MIRLLSALALLAPFTALALDAPFTRERPGYAPVTPERIASLADGSRAAWEAYWQQSAHLAAADVAVLERERSAAGRPAPTPTAETPERLNTRRPPAWYASTEALDLARRVMSYQTPAGGWNKANPYVRVRSPGEEFGREARYRGTFDNGATVTELRFLARVISAQPEAVTTDLRAAFERGLRYVIAAQFPHGGWPQVYPLTGGYHDAVTFNDDAMVNLLTLLGDVAAGRDTFAFVPAETRQAAHQSRERGLACILAAQVKRDGRPVAWGQQHDAITLQPCAARAYEMASLSSSESAALVTLLMTVRSPTPEVIAAIEGALAWFERTAIPDVAYQTVDGVPRQLVAAPGEGPLWSRMIDLTTDRPVFGDRDYTVHPSLETVSAERRRGYAWYTDRPADVLKAVPAWRAGVAATGK